MSIMVDIDKSFRILVIYNHKMAEINSLREKANRLGDIIDEISSMKHNSGQNLKTHANNSVQVHSLEKILEKSLKNLNLKSSFTKTKTYKEGKSKISLKTISKEIERKAKEEAILHLFSNSSKHSAELINSELMRDKEVIQILKNNKRNFGLLESSWKSPINQELAKDKDPLKKNKLSIGFPKAHRKSAVTYQNQLENYHSNKDLIKEKKRRIFNSDAISSNFFSNANIKNPRSKQVKISSQYLSPKISRFPSPIDNQRNLIRIINKFEVGYTPKLESIKLKLNNHVY